MPAKRFSKRVLAELGKTMTDEWTKLAGADGKAILDAYNK